MHACEYIQSADVLSSYKIQNIAPQRVLWTCKLKQENLFGVYIIATNTQLCHESRSGKLRCVGDGMWFFFLYRADIKKHKFKVHLARSGTNLHIMRLPRADPFSMIFLIKTSNVQLTGQSVSGLAENPTAQVI